MQIHYTFSLEGAHQHLIHIELKFQNETTRDLDMLLPAWRPGRYERANYAACIKGFSAKDEKGKRIAFQKTERNTWTLKKCKAGEIRVSYQFYADTINAGSSYVDEQQLYVNPVNCCMHVGGHMDAKVTAELAVPKNYKYSGMLQRKKGIIKAQDLDAWYDSPFVASADLIQHRFKAEGIAFEIAVQGDVPYEKGQIEEDFKKFIEVQVKAFKNLPVDRYCFLIQATPHRHYHGVEHEFGTTITLGPSRSLLKGSVYQDLLGVSSHELYHTWNVKYMRPQEMWPYDFTQENYHRIGHIIEGVTTYEGDVKLWQAGLFSDEQFLKEMKTHLDRHVANMGRFNLSLRESSFDTWVDGYGKSIPDRKVSIYTEGALLSLLFDLAIMKETKGTKGLDTVMRDLYEQCKKEGRGYSEQDYLGYVRKHIGKKADSIFNRFADKAAGYESAVIKALKEIGVQVEEQAVSILATAYGIKCDGSQSPKILAVHPDSDAYRAGVRVGMQLIGIDGLAVEGDAEQLLTSTQALFLMRDGKRLKEFKLSASKVMMYKQFKLSPPKKEQGIWKKWKKGVF